MVTWSQVARSLARGRRRVFWRARRRGASARRWRAAHHCHQPNASNRTGARKDARRSAMERQEQHRRRTGRSGIVGPTTGSLAAFGRRIGTGNAVTTFTAALTSVQSKKLLISIALCEPTVPKELLFLLDDDAAKINEILQSEKLNRLIEKANECGPPLFLTRVYAAVHPRQHTGILLDSVDCSHAHCAAVQRRNR